MRTPFGLLCALALSAVAFPGSALLAADRAAIGVIEIEGAVAERQAPANPFGGSKKTETLRGLIAALREAATRADLKGVVIKLKEPALKTTQIEELGQAMQSLRAAGKKIHVYAYGYDTAELLLGSFADEVIVQSGGGVSLPGVYMEEMYLADSLAWAGVKADYVQVGDYKGASEQMVNSKPSEAWNQNIEQLLDGLYGAIRTELKRGRKMDDAKLDAAMNEGAWATAEDAQKLGLVDAVVDLPDLGSHLEKSYGAEITWNDDLIEDRSTKLDTSNPFALFSALMTKREEKLKRETIAVLHIDGAIIDGDSSAGGFFGGGSSVGSLTIRRALAKIEEEPLVKGVLVRIDSPGGSAIASEVIWQGLRRVADKGKPVYVSVGSMAASGGYYIAVAGDKIFVNPSSIVGSIGVVGGKMALGGLYDHLKVNVVSRSRGPRGMLMASGPAWSESDRAYIRRKMTETYDQFTGRVTKGRPGIDLSKTAEGRLFTGDKAVGLKMADAVGTVSDALTALALKAKLTDGQYDVVDFPQPKGFEEMIEDLFGQFAMAPSAGDQASLSGRGLLAGELAAGAKAMLGDSAWDALRPALDAFMQLRREPVILAAPRAIIVR